MATLTGSRTRTIIGHLAQLLEYPKWLIERDVDFTNCEFDGDYNDKLAKCEDCHFGLGCKWLSSIRDIDICEASLNELTDALRGAVNYLGAGDLSSHGKSCNCEKCIWLGSARQLLRSVSR